MAANLTALFIVLALATGAVRVHSKTQAQNSAICAILESHIISNRSVILEGNIQQQKEGLFRIDSPRFMSGESEFLFRGLAIGKSPALLGETDFRGRVRFSGQWRCASPFKNPSAHRSGFLVSQRWVIRPLAVPEVVSLERRDSPFYGLAFVNQSVGEWFRHFPNLQSLILAVWTGETQSLPAYFQDYYLKGGLMPIIALSGQHVAILTFLCFGCLRLLIRIWLKWVGPLRFNLVKLRRAIPLLCCVLLYWSSGGAPSVVRTFGMICVVYLLKILGWHGSFLQIVGSAVGLLLLWNLDLLSQPGFILSAVGTLYLFTLLERTDTSSGFFQYVRLCAVMPVVLAPFVVFYFSKVSLLAPLNALLVGWLWDLVIIPTCLILPVLGWLFFGLSDPFPLVGLERVASAFVELHQYLLPVVERGYVTSARPTLWELIFVGICFFCTTRVKLKQGGRNGQPRRTAS